MDRWNLTLGKYESLPIMCLKYNIGSLKTHFNDTIYHMLAKTLKFSTTKMKCAQDNKENFTWIVVWARRIKGKEWTNAFWQGGAT